MTRMSNQEVANLGWEIPRIVVEGFLGSNQACQAIGLNPGNSSTNILGISQFRFATSCLDEDNILAAKNEQT